MTDPLGDLFGPFPPFLTRKHYRAGYGCGNGLTHNPGDETYEHRQTASPKDGYPRKASDPSNDGAAGRAVTFENCTFLSGSSGSSPSPAYICPVRAGAGPFKVVKWTRWNSGPAAIHTFENYEPSPPPPHEGIEVGEIVAYRIWEFDDDDNLSSWSMGNIWEPGVPMEKGDGKGVHSWRTYEQARDCLSGDAVAVGSVYLWGEVTVCEDGYLSDFAEVRSIDDLASVSLSKRKKREILTRLRARYGVGPGEPEAPSSWERFSSMWTANPKLGFWSKP